MDLRDSFRELLSGEGQTRATQLATLSDLPLAEVQEAQSVWLAASPERRRALLSGLQSLAEDNIEYNFKNVFLFALEDPDSEVRRFAVEGLWEEEGYLVLERLQDVLRQDASSQVRTAAAMALGRFAYLGAVGDLPESRSEQLQEVLRRSLVDAPDGADLQLRLLEALSYYEKEPLLAEYIARLYREGDEEEQASALVCMGHSLDPRWHSAVTDELDNQSPRVRFHAARAAGEMALSEAVPSLTQIVEDDEEDNEIRGNAIWALGQIGTKLATDTLRNLTNLDSDELREAAEEALGEAMYADSDE